ncbi:MAG: pyridoxine 5'-phosphate synthase [Bacteroidales bacterium]|nr:pyridoxine 5'-phosphate synthase [Bacteroidales bacterium]
MTRLSVNINKVATIRNARGGHVPDVVKFALDCERFGAQGITVHPRPDERHIRYQDVRDLKPILTEEFNIEGNPVPRFVDLVCATQPAQVTLVPDAEDVLTSNAGWDTIRHFDFLKDMVACFKENGIRVSIFIDAIPAMIERAALTGTDRIELYTENYASNYAKAMRGTTEEERQEGYALAVKPFTVAAGVAHEAGLGINAGHDLNLDNLHYFQQQVPHLDEVSIGHALISDALYLGIENAIQAYLNCLR